MWSIIFWQIDLILSHRWQFAHHSILPGDGPGRILPAERGLAQTELDPEPSRRIEHLPSSSRLKKLEVLGQGQNIFFINKMF